jgi:hypothetical protein
MNLQKKLRDLLFEYLHENKSTDKTISEIEKLVYSACQKQRLECADSLFARTPEQTEYHAILNAPLPTEVERCYSGKEVMEIVERIQIVAQQGELDINEFIEFLKKEYGIKI